MITFNSWICIGVIKVCQHALNGFSDLQWCYKTWSLCTQPILRFAVVLKSFLIMHSYKSQICSGATKNCHFSLIKISDLEWCYKGVSKIYMGRCILLQTQCSYINYFRFKYALENRNIQLYFNGKQLEQNLIHVV